MNILNRIDNYLYDREYKIILNDKSINIINYSEIIDFSLNQIKVKINTKILIITGINLSINKMQDNEILITGETSSIIIK